MNSPRHLFGVQHLGLGHSAQHLVVQARRRADFFRAVVSPEQGLHGLVWTAGGSTRRRTVGGDFNQVRQIRPRPHCRKGCQRMKGGNGKRLDEAIAWAQHPLAGVERVFAVVAGRGGVAVLGHGAVRVRVGAIFAAQSKHRLCHSAAKAVARIVSTPLRAKEVEGGVQIGNLAGIQVHQRRHRGRCHTGRCVARGVGQRRCRKRRALGQRQIGVVGSNRAAQARTRRQRRPTLVARGSGAGVVALVAIKCHLVPVKDGVVRVCPCTVLVAQTGGLRCGTAARRHAPTHPPHG